MLQQRKECLLVLGVVEHNTTHIGVAFETHIEGACKVFVGEEQTKQRLIGVGLSLIGKAVVGDVVGKLHIGHIVEMEPETGVHIVDADMEITLFLGTVVKGEVGSDFLVEPHQRDGASEVTVAGVGVDDDGHDSVDVLAQ